MSLRQLEEQLNCSVCLDTYTDPKQLQCFHIFCQKCLVKQVVRDQQGQLSLSCPICRQVTPVPSNGVAGLQSAFVIVPFLELRDSFKKSADFMATEKGTGNAASVSDCFEHKEELRLYCETCSKLICFKCAINGGKHQSHNYLDMKEACKHYKVEIATSLQPIEQQLTIISKALAVLDARCMEISNQGATIEDNLHGTFIQLHETLDIRETELTSHLHQITQRKLKALAVQRDQIETTQARLSSCLEFMRQSLEADCHREVLRMKTTVLRQVQELTATFQEESLKPKSDADITFMASAEMVALCLDHGQVSASSLPVPSNCIATGKGVEAAVVGEMTTVVLKIKDSKELLCLEPVESFECELVSSITGTRKNGQFRMKENGHYEIDYQPTIKGRHQLHIKVEDQHIKGSPFTIAVSSPIENLSTPILTMMHVKTPYGVALNDRGEVVATEVSQDCASVLCVDGRKLCSYGTSGSGPGQLRRPLGVAVDGEGNILVADNKNRRVQKLTAGGRFLAAVGTRGKGPLHFDFPTGIAFNASNNKVYVSDTSNHVQVLNSDLTFSGLIGKVG